MISYIVASNNPERLKKHLGRTLRLEEDDELLVEDRPSIAVAYNEAIRKARNAIKCFVHDDVELLDCARLRADLIEACTGRAGMVGVIGSRNKDHFPWWGHDCCGSAVDARVGVIDFGPGDEPCAVLDGVLLATHQDLVFDEDYPGFHLYDMDICRQMLARGFYNYCLLGGKSLVSHHTDSPGDLHLIDRWAEAEVIYRRKWLAL